MNDVSHERPTQKLSNDIKMCPQKLEIAKYELKKWRAELTWQHTARQKTHTHT